jgi:hypothetical protein
VYGVCVCVQALRMTGSTATVILMGVCGGVFDETVMTMTQGV